MSPVPENATPYASNRDEVREHPYEDYPIVSRRKDQAEIDAQNARDLAEIAASLDALDLEHGLAPAPELRKK